MKNVSLALLAFVVLSLGCSRTWQSPPLESFKPSGSAPPATTCRPCHQAEHDAWSRYDHAQSGRMAIILIEELRECGACHDNQAATSRTPAPRNRPPCRR